MERQWIDVCIATDLEAGELLGMLADANVSGAWQEDGIVHLYWPRQRWSADVWQRLTRLLSPLVVPGSESVRIETVVEQDWNALWARSVTPIRIGRRIVVRPSWRSISLKPGDVEIVLDPKQAFGTGHHATTQLVLEWLEAHVRGGESVLDIGTGSGILAMAALKLGAAAAVGIDTDPVAIDCAKGYADLNGLAALLTLKTNSLLDIPVSFFDMILANLDQATVMELCEAFPRYVHPTGSVAISGVLVEHRQAVGRALADVGGCLRYERERDGWLAMAWTFPSHSGR